MVVTIDKRANGEFASHLAALLPGLYAAFVAGEGETTPGMEDDPD